MGRPIDNTPFVSTRFLLPSSSAFQTRVVFACVSALLAALLLGGCPADPREKMMVLPVATIDGTIDIGPTRLLTILSHRGTPRIENEETRLLLARGALEGLIDEELLMRAALAAKIQQDDDAIDRAVHRSAAGYPTGGFAEMLHNEQLTLADYREATRRRLTIESYLVGQVHSRAAVTPEEVEARYRDEIAKKPHLEEVLVRQVFVRTHEEANHILFEIKSKRISLEAAARRYSTAPEAVDGGALDWFARGDMPEVFDACFELKVGAMSDVVTSDYGYHIFELVARREANATVPLASVRSRITSEIRREKETIEIGKILATLRANANIVIHDDVLALTTAKLPPAKVMVDGGANVDDDTEVPADSIPNIVDAGVVKLAPAPVVPKPVVAKPVVAKPKPVVAKPKPKPAVAKPAPIVAKPVVTKPKPVVAKPAPVVVKPAPVVAKPKPVVAKPVAKPKPVVAKPAPANPSPKSVAPSAP